MADTKRMTVEEVVGRLLGQSLSDGLPMCLDGEDFTLVNGSWTAGGRFSLWPSKAERLEG